MNIYGQRADGTQLVGVGGGIAILLRGDRCSPPIDVLVARELPGFHEVLVTPERRRETELRLARAQVAPMVYFDLKKDEEEKAKGDKKGLPPFLDKAKAKAAPEDMVAIGVEPPTAEAPAGEPEAEAAPGEEDTENIPPIPPDEEALLIGKKKKKVPPEEDVLAPALAADDFGKRKDPRTDQIKF